jgi:hypothetical protein
MRGFRFSGFRRIEQIVNRVAGWVAQLSGGKTG